MQNLLPINGSFVSIQWDDKRHFYWNEACAKFTAEQWQAMIRDMARLGQKYIVIFNVATGTRAVYDTSVLPKAEMACSDPLEAIMCACDKYDMKVFLNNDYYKMECYDNESLMLSKESETARYKMLEEIAVKYASHKSFYGWYFAWEACLSPYYSDIFMKYYSDTVKIAKTYTKDAVFMTSPYGTSSAVCDDKYAKQLENLGADIIAYQDTVGCFAMDTDQSKKSFEILRKAHDKVPQVKLWANIESFTWEGKDNCRETPLIPADFSRIVKQIEAVSPYVDDVISFIFQGLYSNPDSIAYTGYEKAGAFYKQYENWLAENVPGKIITL